MSQDKFKSVAATFQIFKDGEAVSARKLDGIIRRTQDGAEDIQRSLGDMVNQGLAFSGLPLFHNSIARAIGPADAVSVPPLRVFDAPQSLSSTDQGLIRFPYSTATAINVGNKSQNLLPMISQQDKIGIGCVNDEGTLCVARFDQIYDEEKNILPNGLFDQQLDKWETSGVVFDGDFAGMETKTRYNSFSYSEDFLQWTNVSGTLTTRAADSPNGGSNATMYSSAQDGTSLVYLELSGQDVSASTDWCFSIWAASSGTQVTTFLEIDGATHVRGTNGAGAVDPAGSIYSVDISGTAWKRYYVYGTTTSRSSAIARLHLGRNNTTSPSDNIYIWGAQLEPTTYPSEYQETTGASASQHYGETYIGQTLPVIPSKWYQISVDWQLVSGTSWSLIQDKNTLLANSTDASVTKTFKAPLSKTGTRFVGYRDMNIHIYVSGSTADTGPMQLKTFRVDPGTPCHALNCPGFSAYGKTRRYRATLPTITQANHQYFGSQLQFPDEVNIATSQILPGNIMGVFDHEQNHTVPDRLVDWRLASWPISVGESNSLVTDPDFLDTWTTSGTQSWPSEFSISGAGIVMQKTISDVIAIAPGNLSAAPYIWMDAHWALEGVKADLSTATTVAEKTGNFVEWQDTPVTGSLPVGYRSGDGPANMNGYGSLYQPATATDLGLVDTETEAVKFHGEWTMMSVYRRNGASVAQAWYTLGRGRHIGGDPIGASVPTPTVNGLSYVSTDEETEQQVPAAGAPDCTSDGILISISRRDSSFDVHNMVTTTTGQPVHVATNNVTGFMAFNGLFAAKNGTTTAASLQVAEIIVLSGFLDEDETNSFYQWAAEKYGLQDVGTGGTDLDVVQITITTSGALQTIYKTFALDIDEVYTLEYKVKGTLGYAGVYEEYLVTQGAAELDLELDNTYEVIPPTVSSGTTNQYQVSGLVLPGESLWAEIDFDWWKIRRRIRATVPGTKVRLAVGLEGNGTAASILLDSFDVTKVSAESSIFTYDCDAILGLNWDGRGEHVRDENLFQFSDNLLLWQSSGLTRTIDTDSDSLVRIQGASGYIYQTIPSGNLLDDTMTLTWMSHAPLTTSGVVSFIQDTTTQEFPWTIPTQETSGILLVSGIERETGANLEVRWRLYGDEAAITRPQLIHGSGVVAYVPTSASPVKKYRRVIAPASPGTVDATWASGYVLVEGGMIQATQTGAVNTEGALWMVDDNRGFPDQGVIRIAGQEYGYRTKTSGVFTDTVGGWRGTSFNPAIVASGSRVTNVPIPQSITAIDAVSKEITFRDIIPAPVGDWANSLNLQIYNTHVSNLDRFSLQASAVPVTRAVGNLLTAFVQHVGDHRRHFKLSELCGQIIDSSSWASSPVIEATATIVNQTIEELTEKAQLNIEAKRFVPASSKEIIIYWGDGQSSTVTGTGTKFLGNTHTYDLKQIADSRTYTIKVVVKDLNLSFSRWTTTYVVVRPKINPAGQPTKSTVRAGSKIKLPGTFYMTAGAKIKNQNTSTSTAGAKITLP